MLFRSLLKLSLLCDLRGNNHLSAVAYGSNKTGITAGQHSEIGNHKKVSHWDPPFVDDSDPYDGLRLRLRGGYDQAINVGMAGDASHAAPCPTLKSITKSFAAIPAMIRRRT